VIAVFLGQIRGDIDVDDVSVFEHIGAGDPVADTLVDARAHALRKALVVEGGWIGVVRDGELVHEFVDVIRRDAGANHLPDRTQAVGGQLAGTPHVLEHAGTHELDRGQT